MGRKATGLGWFYLNLRQQTAKPGQAILDENCGTHDSHRASERHSSVEEYGLYPFVEG